VGCLVPGSRRCPLVFIVDVVLVVLDPTQPGPYVTAVSGLCAVFVAVIALRAVRRASGGS
jgi:hypothetical protein